MDEQSIFLTALEKTSPDQRAAWLDEACGTNTQLRQRIEALLRRHDDAGSFLEKPPAELGLDCTEVLSPSDTRESPTPPSARDQVNEGDDVSLHFLSPSDQPGSLGRIGQYEVQSVVGRGGMGIVLKALDTRLHRIVAVKVLPPEFAANAAARKRFLREAEAAAAVVHPHVVTIHAVDEDRLPYLVMEFVDGVSLRDEIEQVGTLDVKEILRIGSQIAAGLAAAHKQGLIHRDVKPANILLENGVQRVKITDFGLARAADDVSMTQTGEVAGTPQYMSPEQAEGRQVDARSDLFSLGSVLYAMCTGRSPFRADNPVAVLRRVCDDTPRPIREVNPDIPDWLCTIIDRLLAKQPEDRFQTAQEVSDLLGERLAHLQHPSVVGQVSNLPVAPTAGWKPAPRGQRWSLAAAAALVLLLGSLSLTEATGVTQLRATVIRILTSQGTLIVETDDPAVTVTIEGDGGLIISGAGPQEVRLRPGSYQVQASKDGQPVALDRDLVSISRGDKQVVKVRLEGKSGVAKATIQGEAARS